MPIRGLSVPFQLQIRHRSFQVWDTVKLLLPWLQSQLWVLIWSEKKILEVVFFGPGLLLTLHNLDQDLWVRNSNQPNLERVAVGAASLKAGPTDLVTGHWVEWRTIVEDHPVPFCAFGASCSCCSEIIALPRSNHFLLFPAELHRNTVRLFTVCKSSPYHTIHTCLSIWSPAKPQNKVGHFVSWDEALILYDVWPIEG